MADYRDSLSNYVSTILEVLGNYGLTETNTLAIKFLLRNPYESLIVVDRDCKIQFLDRGSEKFFGLSQGGARGADVKDLIPNSTLPDVVRTGEPIIGGIFELAGTKRIVSTYPILKDGNVVGAIGKLLFRSLEVVQRLNEQVRELQRQVHYFRKRTQGEYSALYTFDDILGSSPLLRSTLEFAKRLSSLDTDILLVGESGTGKELFAHSIHNHGNPERPFVKVNCPAIPPELAESELFGYEKGAFSGALSTGKPGKFELADNGTIFLDEISSLPLSIQSKLLRVIQEREIEKLGGVRPKKITFRLIAATNADLRKLVEEGKFREDLYYRISKAVVQLPPLRERKEDIPLYVNHVLERLRKSIKAQIEISTEAMDLLMAYSWPGNVRQLMNSVEQAAFKAIVPSLDIVIVKPEHLPSEVREVKDVFYSSKRVIGKRMRTNYYGKLQFKTEIRKKEVELLMRALRKASGKKEEAARLLGMPRSTFYEKLRRYKIADKRGL